eukprot:jgi/Mesvir1/17073/Mv00976-RA.1
MDVRPGRATLPLFSVVHEDDRYLYFEMENSPLAGKVRVAKETRYVNGQDFCDVLSMGKKKIKTFTRTKAFEDLLDAMKVHLGVQHLVERVQGGTPSMQGTWMHTSLIWHVAAWISPVFAVAAMDWADSFYNTPSCPKGCMETLAFRMVEEAARQSMQRSEADVRDAVALCVRGQVEVKVGDTNMRADIVSHKCSMIIEVKEVARWTDAVGQLLVYGHHFPGLTKVIVVFDRDGKDIAEEHIEGMEFHVQGLDMMVCTEQYFHKYRA